MAGDTAVVHLGSSEHFPIYSLTTPRGDQIRTPVDEKQNAVVVTSTDMPGNYRLQAGGGESRGRPGIQRQSAGRRQPVGSRQRRRSEGRLRRTPFRLARNRDEIDRSVSAGRVGQELYPYLIVLLVVVLALRASALESLLPGLRHGATALARGAVCRALEVAAHRPSAKFPVSALMSEWYFNPVGGYGLVSGGRAWRSCCC